MYRQKVLRRKGVLNFLLASWRSMTKKTGSGSISQRHGSADPDPHQNVMDPEQWCLGGRVEASNRWTQELSRLIKFWIVFFIVYFLWFSLVLGREASLSDSFQEKVLYQRKPRERFDANIRSNISPYTERFTRISDVSKGVNLRMTLGRPLQCLCV
jgi:hypothetical protein